MKDLQMKWFYVYTNKFDKVRYIEMSVDNVCNLECKMCDSKFSSKLQLRDKYLGNTTHKKLESVSLNLITLI